MMSLSPLSSGSFSWTPPRAAATTALTLVALTALALGAVYYGQTPVGGGIALGMGGILLLIDAGVLIESIRTPTHPSQAHLEGASEHQALNFDPLQVVLDLIPEGFHALVTKNGEVVRYENKVGDAPSISLGKLDLLVLRVSEMQPGEQKKMSSPRYMVVIERYAQYPQKFRATITSLIDPSLVYHSCSPKEAR